MRDISRDQYLAAVGRVARKIAAARPPGFASKRPPPAIMEAVTEVMSVAFDVPVHDVFEDLGDELDRS